MMHILATVKITMCYSYITEPYHQKGGCVYEYVEKA